MYLLIFLNFTLIVTLIIKVFQKIYICTWFLFCRAKIRNIEATEEAKLKLLWERHNKKDGPSQFVPTNMAVNFVQHNRCRTIKLNGLQKYFNTFALALCVI